MSEERARLAEDGLAPVKATPERPGQLRAAMRISLAPYVVSRLMLVAAAVVALVVVPSLRVTDVFTAWDGDWYVSIAQHGYVPGAGVERPSPPEDADLSVDGAVAFFPLYPAIVAGIGAVLPGSLDAAAIAAAFIFGGAAAVAFARLAAELQPDDGVRRAVLLFCFFPGAYILSLAYPEGLLILLACTCLLQLLKGRWVLAGITAALASATRPNGIALAIACAVASLLAIRARREWRSLAAPLLAPLGFVAYISYLGWRTGEPLYWFRVQRVYWHDRLFAWPELRVLFGGSHEQVSTAGTDRTVLVGGLFVGLCVLALLVVILLRARLPAPIVAYALSYEALALLTQALAPRPRFLFAAFPFVLAAGFALKGYVHSLVLAASSAAMAALFLFYTVPFLVGRPSIAP
jgi:hypothetical protein